MDAIIPTENQALQPIESGPLDHNPAAVYISTLTSAQSRRTMTQALNVIARLLGVPTVTIPNPESKRQKERDITLLYCDWAALRYQHTAAIRAKLAESYSPATANKMLAALRGVLKQGYNLGLISTDDYRRAVDLKHVPGQTLPAGRELSAGEIIGLVNACKADKSPAGARDAAILGVLYAGGLRRAEVVALDVADLDVQPNSGKVLVRSGKGRKDRSVYLNDGAVKAVSAWLAVRGDTSGPLFLPINKGGNIQQRRLTTQAIYQAMRKRAEEAGVKDFSPHDFRRTFASDLLDRGADIVTVSKLMGHADVKTTAKYDRRPEEAKKKAARMLHFPY
jgi:integrase/recombinase XerD